MNSDYEKGIAALYASDLAKAESLLSKVIENDPLNADAYFYRGKAKWQNGNLPAAINDFNKVLDINPNHNQAKVSIEMVRQILAFRNPDLYNP
jgi:tetratricopeptide (TPR) repeat protein